MKYSLLSLKPKFIYRMSSPNVVEDDLLLQKEGENICIFYEDYLGEAGEKVQG